MDIDRFEQVLSNLVPKLEDFARQLNIEERDVLASLLELSAIGAQEGKGAKLNRLIIDVHILPKQSFSKADTIEDAAECSILEDLPSRIFNIANR